eukprot:5513171-Amphidinium_carterae.1
MATSASLLFVLSQTSPPFWCALLQFRPDCPEFLSISPSELRVPGSFDNCNPKPLAMCALITRRHFKDADMQQHALCAHSFKESQKRTRVSRTRH